MSSPSKIRADKLLHSSTIEPTKFNYERYSDMEGEFTKENIVEFLKQRVVQQKQLLQDRVS
jgi:hypothetical protein